MRQTAMAIKRQIKNHSQYNYRDPLHSSTAKLLDGKLSRIATGEIFRSEMPRSCFWHDLKLRQALDRFTGPQTATLHIQLYSDEDCLAVVVSRCDGLERRSAENVVLLQSLIGLDRLCIQRMTRKGQRLAQYFGPQHSSLECISGAGAFRTYAWPMHITVYINDFMMCFLSWN